MARVNLFEFTSTISQESISHPNVTDVKANAADATPPQVKEDTDSVCPDKPINAQVSNTKTSEPGPKGGGGGLGVTNEAAAKSGVSMDVSDVAENLTRDQQGGREVDTLPRKVNAKDGLSASDVSTSVENHEGEQSDLSTIDASGTETIPEASELVMDLDGTELEVTGLTDVTEQTLSEADSLVAKSDALSKATATVEKYHGLMVKMADSGRFMSDELRQTISWALEDIDSELFLPERVALESFNPKSRVSLEANEMVAKGSVRDHDIDDGSDPGEVGKGLSAKLKKLFQASIQIFWRIINSANDLLTSFLQDTGKIKNHLGELRKRVNVLEGGTAFQMKNASRLVVGDEFVGDSKAAIDKTRRIAEELLMNWPNALAKILQDWKNGRGTMFSPNHGNLGELIGNLDNTLDRAFRDFDKLNPKDKDKVPSGFLNVTSLSWSGPMPGNMAVYAGIKRSSDGDATTAALQEAQDAVNLGFSLIPGAESRAGEVKVESLSSGEAVSVIRALEGLIGFADDAKRGMKAVSDFADEARDQGWADLLTGAQGQNGQIAGLIVMNLARTTAESQNRFIGYLINLVKAYIGFLEASLKAEAASGNTVDA